MRHGAAFALARVQTVALGNSPAVDSDAELLGNNEVIARNNKMIEGLRDAHGRLDLRRDFSYAAFNCFMNQSAM